MDLARLTRTTDKRYQRPARTHGLLGLIALACLGCSAGQAAELWTLDDRTKADAGPVAELPRNARMPVRTIPQAWKNAAGFELPLPNGRVAAVRTAGQVDHANGDVSLRLASTAKSPVAASGLITTGRRGMFGRLRIDGRLWLLHSDAWGAWLIDAQTPSLELDAFGADVLTPDELPDLPQEAGFDRKLPNAPAKSAPATLIDVMFIYPDSMLERYPDGLLETRINHLVAIANQTLADSGVPALVRVVLRRPVGPLPTENNSEMLGLLSDALAGEFVPGLANLASLRTQFGADLVVLTWPHDIETRGSCGIAFFPRPADAPDPRYGTHITNDGVSNWSICSDAVFTHELGHNLNARHQQFEPDDPQRSNYAYVQLGRFNTVMGSFGTGDPNRFLRLDRFSSPDTLCAGAPCGSIEPGDEADNAAELRRRVAQIAAYAGGAPQTAMAPAPLDADSDGDGLPDSVDPYPLDPFDGQAPAPPPPPEFLARALRTPSGTDDYELLVVDSARNAVLAWNMDGTYRGDAAFAEAVDELPVLTEFSDLAVDGTGLAWLLASADVRRYDRATGRLVDVFLDSERPQPSELLSAFPRALGFDPEGGLVVLGDNAIERFDAQGQRRADPEPGDPSDPQNWNAVIDLPMRAFAFGPEGRFYLAEADQGRILVFDTETGERQPNLAFAGQLRQPRDMAFGADGRLYVADDTRVIRFGVEAAGRPEVFIPPGAGGMESARALAFGPANDLYVADRARGVVLRFNATSGAFIDETVPAGALEAPQAIAIAPKLRALRPGHSGHWRNEDRSGEGWLVETLPDGRATVLWFTYPSDGESEEQLWLTGVGTIEDDRIVVDEMLRTRGGRFGPDFDPATVELLPWGSLTLSFDDCRSGRAEWNALDDAYGSAVLSLRRVARIEGLPCEQTARVSTPERPGLSGQWRDPAQRGQGWALQEVRPGEVFVAWFTYDESGTQAWIVGSGSLAETPEGIEARFDDLLITRGTRFGETFDPAAVERVPWGSATWTFTSCSESVIEWSSSFPGFGSGQLEPTRLTRLDRIDCSIRTGP